MEGYHDWKTTFETKVAYINDKKFLVDDGKGERIVSKNNLLSRFAGMETSAFGACSIAPPEPSSDDARRTLFKNPFIILDTYKSNPEKFRAARFS